MALLHFFCETVGEMLQAVIISVCFVMLSFPRHIFNFTSGNKNYVISLTTRCPKQVKFARFYRSHVHQFPTVYCTELTSILRIPLSPGPERYTYTVPWVRLSHYPCFLPIKRVDPRTPDWLTSLTSFFFCLLYKTGSSISPFSSFSVSLSKKTQRSAFRARNLECRRPNRSLSKWVRLKANGRHKLVSISSHVFYFVSVFWML